MVEMDVGLELEDDVFFADLSKRIALLIMDDDGGEAAFSSASPQATSHPLHQAVCEQACGRAIRGTGVFIPRFPRASRPRRRRAGRSRHAGKSEAVVATVAASAASAAAVAADTNDAQRPKDMQ